jgi:H+/Cl- antiporter ClcA
MWMSPRLWKPRLVFWCGALAIGIISVGFAEAADIAQNWFKALTDGTEGSFWRAWLPLIITPLGFMACSWIAIAWFPNSGGSGIPQAIAARHLDDHQDRSMLLSIRIAIGKIVLTVVGLFCGASIGREGPTVQIGASIMLQSARIGGMEQARGLILAGSAAGIAAAFNTPLAGIVFAIEEMGRAYAARTNGLVLSAVILAGLASLGLVDHHGHDRQGLGSGGRLRRDRRRFRRCIQRAGARSRTSCAPPCAEGSAAQRSVVCRHLRAIGCDHRHRFGRFDFRHRL